MWADNLDGVAAAEASGSMRGARVPRGIPLNCGSRVPEEPIPEGRHEERELDGAQEEEHAEDCQVGELRDPDTCGEEGYREKKRTSEEPHAPRKGHSAGDRSFATPGAANGRFHRVQRFEGSGATIDIVYRPQRSVSTWTDSFLPV